MSEISKRIAELPPDKRKLLLEKLRKNKGEVTNNGIVITRRRETPGNVPLSFAQERLWFLDQLDPGSFAYNMPMSVRLTGNLDVAAFRRAINAVVKRHEILRTKFLTWVDRPVQVVEPEVKIEIPLTDLTDRSCGTQSEAEVERLKIEEAEKRFDLATGPLLRGCLLKLGVGEHQLLLTMHHIISDGVSLAVLFEELGQNYAAFINGEKVAANELPIQYSDFAIWERKQLQGEALEKKLSYWVQQLAGMNSLLELPFDHARPAMQTSHGSVEYFYLSDALSKKIKDLSLHEGTTLFMTLISAFKILLMRYTGQQDLVVGTPYANRYRKEIENLIGFFVNNLVLRTDLSGNPTFRQVLARVKPMTLEAFDHSDVPFSKLVEAIQPTRDLSSSPLFHVMFNLLNPPIPEMDWPGLKLYPEIRGNYNIARFDLTLGIGEEGEQLAGAFEYNTDLFNVDTIKRMAGHFQILLESIVDNPDLPVQKLNLLSATEKQQLLFDWNDTTGSEDQPVCIHHIFEKQALKTPDKVAVVFNEEQATYGDLNARANQLAHYLGKAGITRESLVGICVEPSIEMLIALLGTLKAGAAYVPLDPAFPRQRLDYMIDDAGMKTLLTQEHLLAELTVEAIPSICLDSHWNKIREESEKNPAISSAGSNPAYVIYTSGSTGKPKGVTVPHSALTNFLRSMQEQPGLTKDDVLCAVTTLSFDIAGLELYLPLITGAQLVLANRETVSDGKLLADFLTVSATTVMQATPATWQMLLASGWSGNRVLKVLCGGEKLSAELAKSLLAKTGSVWNMYGPTETTIWSTIFPVQSVERNISIGRPIKNTEIYLLDINLQPVAVGIPGELYIGGSGLARGYLNRPELTAERFIPHPFSKQPGFRLYRTGDLARYLPDADIEYLGRIDQQVKLRGFRIEPGEIETTVLSHRLVQQAVVLSIVEESDSTAENNLVAYLVIDGKEQPSINELRSYLKESLPDYMVPSFFIFLPSMPLTPNGKVNHRELPRPDGSRPMLENEYVEPQNQLERQIAEIWQEVLRMENVGVNDNFFSLGGHSLQLVQVQGKFAEIFNKPVSILELFRYPTIRDLAQFIEIHQGENTDYSKIRYNANKRKQAIRRRKHLSNRQLKQKEQKD